MKMVLRLCAIGGVVLGLGCDAVPIAPVADPQFSTTEKLQALARYNDGPLKITIAFAAKTIGPEGGSISILGFEAVVPPGAVASPTRFTIRLPVDPSSEYVRAEFGPHGQQFAVPVTLRLPHKGTSAESNTSTRVLWWDGTTWVPFSTVLREDGRIETQTSHFSEYGTEDPNAKGITLANRPCGSACRK